MSSLIGTKVGNFRVVDLLSRGGMGEVYVGYDEKLERKVALKAIRAEHRLDKESKARFLREARVLSQLAHPNICQIFEYIEGDEADVLALELIEGSKLSGVVAKGLDFRNKLSMAIELAEALVAAHGKGIVHRDLKPDNVMVDDKGRVKVLDFGLSRSIADEETLQVVDPSQPEIPPFPVDVQVTLPSPAPAVTGFAGSDVSLFQTTANTALPAYTPTYVPTDTPLPTDTPVPTLTDTPQPSDTPAPTDTQPPAYTSTPVPTDTQPPADTPTPAPTDGVTRDG